MKKGVSDPPAAESPGMLVKMQIPAPLPRGNLPFMRYTEDSDEHKRVNTLLRQILPVSCAQRANDLISPFFLMCTDQQPLQELWLQGQCGAPPDP